MKYADYGCAWVVFAAGILGVMATEVRHPPGVMLDTPLLWIFLALLNLLRLRNGYSVKGLKVFCVGANVSSLALEALRLKTFGPFGLIVAVPLFCETGFSIIQAEPDNLRDTVNHVFDRATSGILSAIIAAVGGFLLLIPLMATFDARNWPLFNDWAIWHGSILVAWPALSVLSFCGIRGARWFWERAGSNRIGPA
jgi:hypothetical protein